MAAPKAEAQIDDLLGAISEAAESIEDENSNNSNDPPSESDQRIQDELERRNEESASLMSRMEGKYQRCLLTMLMYYDTLERLRKERKLGNMSMTRCDSYDMQLSALATSTTIMYCPESINELSMLEKLELVQGFIAKLKEEESNGGNIEGVAESYLARFYELGIDFSQGLGYGDYSQLNFEDLPPELQDDLRDLLEELGEDASDNPLNNPDIANLIQLNYLLQFFEPQFIVKRSLQIVEERGEMGCN